MSDPQLHHDHELIDQPAPSLIGYLAMIPLVIMALAVILTNPTGAMHTIGAQIPPVPTLPISWPGSTPTAPVEMQSTPTLTLIPIDVDLPAPTLTPYTVVYDTTTGPLGCPLRPDLGTVVMTQGYGVGTHAPAAIWGAVDLAVDMDGDGSADITGSSMVPLVSTMGGTVELLIDPTVGNVVRIVQGKWVVAYAHVAPFITEADGRIVSGSVHHGDQIAPGVLVGFSSNTGQSPSGTPMGPHLDYQIWQSEVNVDPTPRITC